MPQRVAYGGAERRINNLDWRQYHLSLSPPYSSQQHSWGKLMLKMSSGRENHSMARMPAAAISIELCKQAR